MGTGNNVSASLVKKDYSLGPDNAQDLAGTGQKSFVDISRNGIQVLRINSQFKAVGFNAFKFPHCIDDQRWCDFVEHIVGSNDFKTAVSGSDTVYSMWDNKVTLIPTALYNENQQQANLEFLFGNTVGLGIRSQELQGQDSIGVYALPSGLSGIISKPIANSYLHWLNSISNNTGTVANVTIGDSQFGLVVRRNDALLFSNWFEIKKVEDILYFIMATLESLSILHSDVELVLSGEIEKNDAVHSAIGKFISNVSFGNRPKNLEYAYAFKELASHKYPFIFSTACA